MIIKYIYRFLILIAISGSSVFQGMAAETSNSRDCRNLIIEGNRLFKAERFGEAEVKYQKALQADPTSQVAQFNLASALLRQGRISDLQDPNSSISRAVNTFSSMIADPKNSTIQPELIEKSFYNLGNVAYEQENYAQAVEMYKGALRVNPSNEHARENLRLAQLKLQQQNKDKNKDQNQDKDKDKEQNQENKQDKKEQDKKQDDNQKQDDKKDEQQQQPRGGINDENAAQILKTMENEEAATRRRIQLQQGKRGNASAHTVGNPW